MPKRFLPILALVFLPFVALACPSAKPADRGPLGLPTQDTGGALGALSYSVPCYTAQGGASIVVGSGCTLDATAGTVLGGAVSLVGVITNAANLEHIGLPTWVTTPITYTAAAGGTVVLASIGAGEKWWIHDIRVNVTSNFNATGDDATMVIGDGGDADGFCVLADAELQAADTEGTGFEAGWQCQVAATRGVYIDGTGGFMYSDASAETIDAIIDETSGETITAGAATVHILYTRIQ